MSVDKGVSSSTITMIQDKKLHDMITCGPELYIVYDQEPKDEYLRNNDQIARPNDWKYHSRIQIM
ncbi:2895_t:CDS:2 [Funneliformis caledonium]|uniref:2895_t:CDS:1 n=1 Tax=Funneliformis caledonium TaxID=1117310 RepID=A0A9N9I2Y4_9GLOM|nr:2895_t:CDS:2 [Funneliformis caledonium]